MISVKPDKIERSEKFLQKIDNDHWDQDLWDEFHTAVQDPDDSHAIKDLNRLATRFLSKSDGLTEDTKALINGLFITVCGSGLDTLIKRSIGEEDD